DLLGSELQLQRIIQRDDRGHWIRRDSVDNGPNIEVTAATSSTSAIDAPQGALEQIALPIGAHLETSLHGQLEWRANGSARGWIVAEAIVDGVNEALVVWIESTHIEQCWVGAVGLTPAPEIIRAVQQLIEPRKWID